MKDNERILDEIAALHTSLKARFPIASDDTLIPLVAAAMVSSALRERETGRSESALRGADAAFPYHLATTIVTLPAIEFTHDGGFGYQYPGRAAYLAPGDCNEDAHRSALILLEDGKPLGPAHTTHQHIREKGAGRYSHWGDVQGATIYFASSDNSDPRKNGRRYEIAYLPF